MEWLHTWGGRSFGYRDGDDLWTHDGKHVGRFRGDEVYGHNGSYLGELRGGRLITNTSERSKISGSVPSLGNRVGHVQHVDYVGNVMLAGYEDFPQLEE